MKVRTAAVCFVVTFAVGVVRAHAQGPPPAPGGGASLAARIEALEARVAALETINESDIVGSYKFAVFGIELNRGFAGTPAIPAQVGTSVTNAVVTLNADHTVQFSGSALDCTLPVLTLGIVTCEPADEEEGPAPPTWSIANGALTISAGDPNDQLVFPLAANGVFVASDSSEFQPGHGWAVIFVMSKLAN
jgi:hypothetical protein